MLKFRNVYLRGSEISLSDIMGKQYFTQIELAKKIKVADYGPEAIASLRNARKMSRLPQKEFASKMVLRQSTVANAVAGSVTSGAKSKNNQMEDWGSIILFWSRETMSSICPACSRRS